MTTTGIALIDPVPVRDKFDGLDPATRRLLFDAIDADLREWVGHLTEAVTTGDAVQAERARHTLKGLCGTFGAIALLDICLSDLTAQEARGRLWACVEASLCALQKLVGL